MRNYLQRVLSSGARTTSPAKPPTVARPLIPPVAPPGWMPLEEGAWFGAEPADLKKPFQSAEAFAEIPASLPAHDVQTQSPEVVRNQEPGRSSVSPEPQPPIGASSHTVEPPVSGEVVSAPAMVTAIRVPKGMRRAVTIHESQSAMVRAIEQTLSALAPRASQGPTESASAIPNAQDARPLSRIESPAQVQPKPAAAGPMPVLPAEVTQAPLPDTTIAQPEARSTMRSTDAEARSVDASPANLRAPAANIEPRSRQRAMETQPIRGPHPPLEREVGATHVFELPAKPPQAAARPALSALSESRRRQISIGRIDVQVNNVAPVAEAEPRATRTRSHSTFLEARYLNRFSLKP